jgi:hypothetical protein
MVSVRMNLKVLLLFAVLICFTPCVAQADDLPTDFQLDFNVIIKFYQGYIKGSVMENNLMYLLLSNGEKLVYDDKKPKSFEEKLENPDLKDTLSLLYPLKNPIDKMALNNDPGRFRSLALLKAVYGKNKKEVRTNLIRVNFCGKKVLFNRQNGAADALKNAGIELSALTKSQPQLKTYIKNLGGTFKWRNIAGTRRLSPHSFGIAIDLNPKRSSYWRGRSESKIAEFSRLNYPAEIVAVFEKNGFIWGGKWYHYDTMHFEFRPEIIAKAR